LWRRCRLGLYFKIFVWFRSVELHSKCAIGAQDKKSRSVYYTIKIMLKQLEFSTFKMLMKRISILVWIFDITYYKWFDRTSYTVYHFKINANFFIKQPGLIVESHVQDMFDGLPQCQVVLRQGMFVSKGCSGSQFVNCLRVAEGDTKQRKSVVPFDAGQAWSDFA